MSKIICEKCGCEVPLTNNVLNEVKCPTCGNLIKNVTIAPQEKLFIIGDQGMALPSLKIIVCYENRVEILNKRTRELEHSILFSQIENIKASNLSSKITFELKSGEKIVIKIATQFAPSAVVKKIQDVMN